MDKLLNEIAQLFNLEIRPQECIDTNTDKDFKNSSISENDCKVIALRNILKNNLIELKSDFVFCPNIYKRFEKDKALEIAKENMSHNLSQQLRKIMKVTRDSLPEELIHAHSTIDIKYKAIITILKQ